MKQLASRLADAIRQYRGALFWVLLRKLLPVGCRMESLVLFRKALLAPHLVPASHLAAFDIHRLRTPQDLWFHDLCLAYPDKNFAARLAEPGRYCWVAVHDERIAGYAWLSCTALVIEEIGCSFDTLKSECFIHDCFVEPARRGHGLYPHMLEFILRDCSELDRSLQSASIAAVATNQASLRGIRKAGFTEYARIRHVQWRSRRWWWGWPVDTLSDPAIQVKY